MYKLEKMYTAISRQLVKGTTSTLHRVTARYISKSVQKLDFQLVRLKYDDPIYSIEIILFSHGRSVKYQRLNVIKYISPIFDLQLPAI